ncbi:MAG TPA: LLM class flavin-dependent oxidoreductase [Gammaproteobacteria bacterium]|nr:LLM class flavin-dependent oxidoreductase [Gammaproteobacteria bacterium]
MTRRLGSSVDAVIYPLLLAPGESRQKIKEQVLTTALKFGLAPPSNFWNLDWQQRQAAVAQILDAGFELMFMADHVSFRNGSGTDGMVECAALSQLHPKLGVMTGIYLLPLRHPLPVARQLASIASVAQGRMIFGVGIGGEDPHELEICGVDPRRRGLRANESLAIIRSLLAGETVTFEGKEFNVQEALIRPTPKSPIPIVVGGRSDAALTRTAKFGEGWLGVWCSANRFAQAVGSVAEQAQALGRNDVDWMHGYQPWIGMDWQDGKAAHASVKAGMEAFYRIPFEKFERYTPSGTPAQVAEQLAPYIESGARLFNIKVCARHTEEEVALGAELVSEMRRLGAALAS